MARSPAVKRLQRELAELETHDHPEFVAYPLEDNLFEWHFTLKGPEETPFEGGLYHGKILFPSNYPFQPPDISFLTPNGRFEVGKKICLSITGYHPEYWRPAWGVRLAIMAIISFMPSKGMGAVGAIDAPDEQRRVLAAKSHSYHCALCGKTNTSAFHQSSDDPVEADSLDTSEPVVEESYPPVTPPPTTASTQSPSNAGHKTKAAVKQIDWILAFLFCLIAALFLRR